MSIRPGQAPTVLNLVGHDLRWKLVRVLASGDHRVNELVDVLGEPQNLVSYHLRLLRQGQLVVERRSSADARDIYYHLDLERLGSRLTDSAALVHPAISFPSARPKDQPARRARRPRVLFICTGNSARSQMAEAILRHELGSSVDVYSAGPAPSSINPLALEVLEEMGISTKGLRSKGLEALGHTVFDVVITLCDKAREVCGPVDAKAAHSHWSLPDPTAVAGSIDRRRAAFRKSAAEITRRVRHLIPVITVTKTRTDRLQED